MDRYYFKLCIMIVTGLLIMMKTNGQVSNLEKYVTEKNKACPIIIDEATTISGYELVPEMIIQKCTIKKHLSARKMEKLYDSDSFKDVYLSTLAKNNREFMKMLIDENMVFARRFYSINDTYIVIYPASAIKEYYDDETRRLERKASMGDAPSQHNLGVEHLHRKEYNIAFSYFKKAAKQGFVLSQINLALCYSEGWGTEQDFLKAEYWYKKAIESGDRKNAPLNLGQLYIFQLPKYDEAIKYLKDLAEQGDILAQCNIGCAYLRLKKYDDALYWEEKAANAGDHLAENNLGIWYLKGLFGFIVDYDKAIYWNERAAKAGKKTAQHNLRIAQFKKGEILYNSSKFKEAFTLFMEAANNTDNPIPGAFRQLSACYRYGKGVEKNEQTAQFYWDEAIKYNDEIAMEILGVTNYD